MSQTVSRDEWDAWDPDTSAACCDTGKCRDHVVYGFPVAGGDCAEHEGRSPMTTFDDEDFSGAYALGRTTDCATRAAVAECHCYHCTQARED